MSKEASERMKACLRRAIAKRYAPDGWRDSLERVLEASLAEHAAGFTPETLWLALEIATSDTGDSTEVADSRDAGVPEIECPAVRI